MIRFNRLELAGSLGDLGTLLPIAIAMVLFNGLSATGVFLSIALLYIVSGFFYQVTVPVQPMKVIGAYAIATGVTPLQISASSLLLAVFLLLVALTRAVDLICWLTPQSVIRGVQFTTGSLLIAGGVRFVLGTSVFQQLQEMGEPFLKVQDFHGIPLGLLIGIPAGIMILLLLDNKKFPAALMVLCGGICAGIFAGAADNLSGVRLQFGLPGFLPFGIPRQVDFAFVLFALVLPQLPMTMGNAVLAYTDLSRKYFGENSCKVTNRNVCLSMALANVCGFCIGGMPLCHGAGGLAAHYRFGARTAGSNIMIGSFFLVLVLFFGESVISFMKLLPMSILGVLLVFSGAQLCLAILDMRERKEFFVIAMMLGITLASNLAAGFVVGIVLAWFLRWKRVAV